MTQMLLTIMNPIVQLSGSLLFRGEVCSGGGEARKCEPLSPPSVRDPESSVPVGSGPSPPSSLRLHLQAARPQPAGDRPQGGPEVPCRSEGLIYLSRPRLLSHSQVCDPSEGGLGCWFGGHHLEEILNIS